MTPPDSSITVPRSSSGACPATLNKKMINNSKAYMDPDTLPFINTLRTHDRAPRPGVLFFDELSDKNPAIPGLGLWGRFLYPPPMTKCAPITNTGDTFD
jgi:hypothetical protein